MSVAKQLHARVAQCSGSQSPRQLAQVLVDGKNFRAALQDFDRAIELYPGTAPGAQLDHDKLCGKPGRPIVIATGSSSLVLTAFRFSSAISWHGMAWARATEHRADAAAGVRLRVTDDIGHPKLSAALAALF